MEFVTFSDIVLKEKYLTAIRMFYQKKRKKKVVNYSEYLMDKNSK